MCVHVCVRKRLCTYSEVLEVRVSVCVCVSTLELEVTGKVFYSLGPMLDFFSFGKSSQKADK